MQRLAMNPHEFKYTEGVKETPVLVRRHLRKKIVPQNNFPLLAE
jgi:hypothetical protein